MRGYRVAVADLWVVVANPVATSEDGTGNRIVVGVVAGGRLRVVIAADDPRFIITVYERRA